ncbi:PKD domain-containing protein [Homoserinibacter sp. GY 40078]|uniref:PKD domain-containing protein n=1 Tax=Homoserinibacter sp. GY 40078 TaxID=2603275 RepID=UPI0021039BEB|nr:PKD domain-containing protein [Homoserinibacter sp. GY 40078]
MGTPEPTRRSRPRALALVTTAALFLSALIAVPLVIAAPASADPLPASESPETVSSDPLPTPQINGVVWTQVIVGNTVYVGGQFTTARPAGSAAGQNEVTRTHLLAYNLTTGALLSWAPTLNAQVRSMAASPDGTRLYVGGDFTQVNGSTRNRIVAFSTATGNVITSFAASANNWVSAIAATNSTVYIGGIFGQMSGTLRSFLAAVNASDGQTTAWAPETVGGRPYAIEVSPDQSKVVVGGDFTSANGSTNPGYGLVMVDSSTGASLPLGTNTYVRNAGTEAAIFSLDSDSDSFYGTGYVFGSGGNLESTFRADWATGDLKWVADCHGDTYSVAAAGDVIYTASHTHYCGNLEGRPQYDPWTFNRGVAFTKESTQTATADPYGYYNWQGTAAPTLLNWFPSINAGTYTGIGQGPWSVSSNGDYVVYGGEFTTVNNKAQQGLVRFAVRDLATNLDGPRLAGDPISPRLTSPEPGVVSVSWTADWDRDDPTLEYQLIRDGKTASPIYTTQVTSNFWTLPTINYLDTGLDPGSTHTYRVRVIDPWGNNAWSSTISVNVATAGTLSSYARGVLADNPTSYFRLGDASGTSGLTDSLGVDNGTSGTGVSYGASGAIIGDTDTSASFNGTNNGRAATSTLQWRDNSFTLETWVKTTTTSGGKILGFGSSATGNSGSYDRHLYMSNDGRINFGVYPNASRIITSGKAYNDGQWHHVVATLGSGGMALYVDSVRVARNTAVTYGQNYWGYWRIGGDSTWAGGQNFNGQIDEVAVYPTVLSASQIVSHYTLSGRTSTVPPAPSDVYGAAVYGAEPLLYWRLGESAGTTAADSGALGNPGTYRGSPTLGANGVLDGVSNTAVGFGSTNALVSSNNSFANPTVYTEEAWFTTTTTSGGKIMGFGNRQTGTSSSYDRHVYMRNDGTLVFGVYTGQENVITTPLAYNDGKWHHVAASQGAGGMKLYVDGVLVGTNPQTSAENYTGYWRVGGDTTWAGASSSWFSGVIDEFAVYDIALPDSTIAQHYTLGAPPLPNQAPTAAFTSQTTSKLAEFDASGSTDSDGTIESYSWDFGDGTSGTGETASHVYTASGTYTVTLTVVDDDDAPGVVSHDVTITIVIVPPTAAFTTDVDGLDVDFDATGSTDADGTVESYAWDFGDGHTGTGATTSHSYTATGDYTVELTVTDDDGATDTVSHTVHALAPNQTPSASFTATSDELDVSVDAGASSDPDGTIASYSWNWGDGSPAGSGATASHSYAASGTYTITLTVTDDRSGTDTTTRSVTVTAPEPPAGQTIAQDPFTRTASNGWGSAPTGGPWSVSSSSYFAVTGTQATVTHNAGALRRGVLEQVSATDVDVSVSFSADKATSAGHIVAGVLARRVSGSEYYQARARLLTGGVVALQITQGSSSTVLANATIAGLSYSPGDKLTVRLEASGTSPTTLKAKLWKTGTTEPGWQLTVTDSTAALQTAGAVGLESYISGSATNAPVVINYDDYTASTLGAPAPNQAPTASFTTSVSDLQVTVDAGASSDADGSIASYSWNWGDGSPAGSGATAAHSYAAAGTYTVTLTVTDDDGAGATTTHSVTTTDPVTPPDTDALASDDFERALTGGWGDATVGGTWDVSSSSNSAVADGAGALTHGAGALRRAFLTSVSATDVDMTVTVAADKPTTAGHIVAGAVARRVSSADYYQARVRLLTGGAVALQITRGNTSTVLANATVTGMSYTPGDKLTIRFEVSGTSPTTLRAKVWAAGETEPSAWLLTTTDSTSALQTAGTVGVESYVSASATNAPVVVSYDDFVVVELP